MTRPSTDLRARARSRWRDPVFWTDVTQLFKTVLAAVAAWVVATAVLDLQQPFLAPWSALLVVHATVYRTFSQGLRQVSAAVLGVLLAWAVGNALGLDTVSVAVAMAVGLAVGALGWFAGQETAVAATALVVLTTGFSDNDNVLLMRLADTAIGIGVGLLVNLLVWPPLRRRTAISAMDAIDDRIGGLLVDMAAGLRRGCDADDVAAWVDQTRDLDEALDRAWSLVRQAQESARMNPRRSARELRDPRSWFSLLRRMEQALAETRSMARTLGLSLAESRDWEASFRDPWLAALDDAGRAISEAEDAPLREVHTRLRALTEELGGQTPLPALWPEYGGLIVNLRNIVDAMDEVAAANPLGQPPLPFRRRAAGLAGG